MNRILQFLPIQPRPVVHSSVRERHADGTWSTSIARLFRPEDVPHCRLCDRCMADPSTGLCLIVAPAMVPPADVPLYSTAGKRVVVQRTT